MLNLPWRSLQVIINIATIISGFCTVMPIAYIRKYFTGLCILYADIRLSSANGSAPSLTVDMVNSIWGSSSSCDFPTYTPLVASIHAFIWCWYIVLMKKQLKTEQYVCHQIFSNNSLYYVWCQISTNHCDTLPIYEKYVEKRKY